MKVVLLGASGFAEMWYKTILEYNYEVTAIVDINKDSLKRASESLNVPFDKCFNENEIDWENIDCDILIDSTPPFNRVKRLSGIAKHVDKLIICAKPYAINREDELKMQELINESKCELYVAYQKRNFSPFAKIKNLIDEHISLQNPQYIKIDMDMDGTVWEPGKEWRTKLPFSSLIDGAIHHFDLIDWWFGIKVNDVNAYSWSEEETEFENEPNFTANYKLENGCIVQYSSRWTNKKSRVKHYFTDLTIEFEKDIIEIIGGKLYLNKEYIELHKDGIEGMDLSELNYELFPKIIEGDKTYLIKNRKETSEILFKTIEAILLNKHEMDYLELIQQAFCN